MQSIKLYFRMVGISISSQLEYRLSFFLQTISFFLLYFVQFGVIFILFDRFKNIKGWEFYEICIFYGLINISYSVSDVITQRFQNMPNLVRNGEFDRYMLRPCNVLVQLLGFNFSLDRLGRLIQGIVVLIIGFMSSELTISFYILGIILWTVIGGSCLFTSILIFQAALTFKTIESTEFMLLLTSGGVETAQYPINIYTSPVQKFFTYILPLAFVNYFSILPILSRSDHNILLLFQNLAPGIGIVFLLLSLVFWKKGLRWYASTGT